jgi:hypothetical protein
MVSETARNTEAGRGQGRGRRFLRGLGWLGLAGLAGLYALVFGEFFLRVMAPQALMPRYVVGTDWGIRGNEPGISYRHSTPEVEVVMTTNSLGMRDTREHAFQAPPGTCRIALLGDSYFMGYEAALEETIAGYLEAFFEDAGYDLDVLNFAVSGHGTAEMLLQFENLAARFSPDITVFQFHGSDYADNVRANLFRLDAEGQVVATGRTYLPAVGIRTTLEAFPAYRWMSENSHIYAGLRERAAMTVKSLLARLRSAAAVEEDDEGAEETEAEVAAARAAYGPRLTAALIAEAQARARAAGSDWYMLDIPSRRSRTEFVSRLGRMDLPPEILDATVAVEPVFAAHADPEVKLYYEQGHFHFTPLGNRLAAEALFERIREGSAARLATCRAAAQAGAGPGAAEG